MRHNPGLIRNLLALAIPAFLLVSCENKNRNVSADVKEMKTSDISLSPIRHDTLSKEQLDKIKQIQTTFAEVNPTPLDTTIENFKRDQNPDREIAIWLTMGKVYKGFLEKKGKKVGIEEKNEAYELILLRSMMPEEEAKTKARFKLLTDDDVKQIFNLYTEAPAPIVIEK
jgi:hypothetical protein